MYHFESASVATRTILSTWSMFVPVQLSAVQLTAVVAVVVVDTRAGEPVEGLSEGVLSNN